MTQQNPFANSIDHDDSPGVRLNVVSFPGNEPLFDALDRAIASFNNKIIRTTRGPPTATLVRFPTLTQAQGMAVASIIREAGFSDAGTCLAATRYSTAPENDVDYLIAFE